MLWISLCENMCIALLGGFFGGGLIAISLGVNNRFNMRFLEKHWQDDVYHLQGGIRLAHHKLEELEKKLLTLSVDKPVNKHINKYRNNGYKHQRHFNHRG